MLLAFIGRWGNKKPGRRPGGPPASRAAKAEKSAAEKEEEAIRLIQTFWRMYIHRKKSERDKKTKIFLICL